MNGIAKLILLQVAALLIATGAGCAQHIDNPATVARSSFVPEGRVERFDFDSPALGNRRTIRVWLPSAYDRHATQAFPLFMVNDGQACFGDIEENGPVELQLDETLSRLASLNAIDPVVVACIDSGPKMQRNWEYLPYDPGEHYPEEKGGGLDTYVDFLASELLPDLHKRYRLQEGPDSLTIGGSSYGAFAAMYAALSRPDRFGKVWAESPSFWIADERFMSEMRKHEGPWPQRVFAGMGTQEINNAHVDRWMVDLAGRFDMLLDEQGLDERRRKVVVGEGQSHNTLAWRARFEGAARFLFAPEG